MCSLGAVMLSPFRPETGIATMSCRSICLAKSRYSATIVSKISREYSTRSILLIASTTLRMPSSDDQEAVAARLRQHALAGVDQDHGQLGGRGAGHHVAGVLLVPRRVGDDELALVGREEAVGDVDGDALLALGGEAIDQQREVELAALRADLLRVGLERRELVLEDHLRVVEQPADQRGLAVVDAAAGDEAQQALVLVLVQVGLDVLLDQVGNVGHQKYPSCFFFSIDADWSWSMTRPWRSELVVSSISWMIAGSVSASLSTAPVSG